MAANPITEKRDLSLILGLQNPSALIVRNATQGQLQISAMVSGLVVGISLNPLVPHNLLDTAPVSSWRTSSTLMTAVENGWLFVDLAEDQVTPTPGGGVLPEEPACCGIVPPFNPQIGDLLVYSGTAWDRLPPGTSGRFLRTNGNGLLPTWEEVTILGGLTIPSFNPTTLGPGPGAQVGVYEIGDTVVNPGFVATTANDAGNGPTNALLTNNANGESKNVQPDFGGSSNGVFISDQSYLKNSAVTNGSVVFTLTADDGGTPAVRTSTSFWYRRVYWGFVALDPGTYTEAFVKTSIGGGGSPTTRSSLKSGKSFTIVLSAPGGPSYVFFAYPQRHGVVSSIIDNVTSFNATSAFALVGTAPLITTENGAAVSETYNVYRSNFLQTGSVNLTVS